jgi:hypothetical protein
VEVADVPATGRSIVLAVAAGGKSWRRAYIRGRQIVRYLAPILPFFAGARRSWLIMRAHSALTEAPEDGGMRRQLSLSLVLMVLTACTPTPYTGHPVPSSDVLLAPEIVNARVMDTYQAVSQLRPQFMKVREPLVSSFGRKGLRVYLDDVELGDVEALRMIPIDQVTAIRYLNASEAQLRWGSDLPNGVILVSTSHVLSP